MKKNVKIIIALLILFHFSIESSYAANDRKYIVNFKDTVDYSVFEKHNIEVIDAYNYQSSVLVVMDASSKNKLLKSDKINFIEEDILVAGSWVGDSEMNPLEKNYLLLNEKQSPSWGFNSINIQTFHDQDLKGQGIKVGIMDSGIDYNHPDLKVYGGENFVYGEDSDFIDEAGHGTHVAGIVAAIDNSIGTVGVAPESELYAIKVLNSRGIGNLGSIISGIEWAVANKIDVLNMSIAIPNESKALTNALKIANKNNILMVASAGNTGHSDKGSITNPANTKYVIATGSINEDGTQSYFSAVGKELDIMAPGENILSTVPNGYMKSSGTSMAAPHISGLAALILENEPGLSPNKANKILLDSTSKKKVDKFIFGNGIIDANITYEILIN